MLLQLWLKKEAFLRCTQGATAIEYGLIVAGISVTISVVVFIVGSDLTTMFAGIGNQLISVTPAA